MTKDLISIIIPCYNVSKFLDDCFESLKNQTYKNFEVIFVDDGSADDTLKKLENFCSTMPNCRVFSQKNMGVSVARNKGLAEAKGEFVYFYDSDDLLSPNALEILRDNIENADISVCNYKVVKEEVSHQKIRQVKKKHSCAFSGTEEILSLFLSTKTLRVNIWNKLFRTSILKQMDGFPNVFDPTIYYGEDLDFVFRYLTLCTKASYTSSKLYFYRSRKGSEVHSSFNAKKMLSVFKSHDQNISICSQKFPVVEKYVRAFKCVSCVEMLFRIWASDFDDRNVILKLFEDMKINMKSLKKSKKVQRYKRWTIPLVPPLLKLLFIKRLKVRKKSN